MELSLFSVDLTLPTGTITGTPTYGPANKITSASGGSVISSTGNVTIKAGKLVLNSGFKVAQGGQLRVQLVPYFTAAPTVTVSSPNKRTLAVAPVTWIGGEPTVTYQWSKVSGPGTVTFAPNTTNAAKTTLATLTSAGAFVFQVTATATDGSANSYPINVTIPVTGNVVVVTPTSVTLPILGTRTFAASVTNQFGMVLSPNQR